MGNDPQAQIDVSPYVQNGVTKWNLKIVNDAGCPTDGNGGGHYPVLNVCPGQLHTILTIAIVNGQGWTFPRDGSAIWITDQGTSYPTGPVPLPATIKSIQVFPNGSGLRLVDTNHKQNAQDLYYTLNFVNGSQKSSTLDPIIRNGGCCPGGGGFTNTITLSTTAFVVDLGIALLVGVLLALIVQRFRSR